MMKTVPRPQSHSPVPKVVLGSNTIPDDTADAAAGSDRQSGSNRVSKSNKGRSWTMDTVSDVEDDIDANHDDTIGEEVRNIIL